MKKQATTQENLIKTIEFRQAMHTHGFGKQRDALSEVLDAFLRYLLFQMTAQRVQQALPPIFAQFGSPARKPKMCGKSPSWLKGRRRTPKQRFKVIKKQLASV